MTKEQKENIFRCGNLMIEQLKPVIELIENVWHQLKEILSAAYKHLKEYLEKDISTRTKKHKKGKKYIHNYKKIQLWKFLNNIKV